MITIRRHISFALLLLLATSSTIAQSEITDDATIDDRISSEKLEEIIDGLEIKKTKKVFRPRSTTGDSTTANSRSSAKEILNKKEIEVEESSFSIPPFIAQLIYYLLILLALGAVISILFVIFSNIGDGDKEVDIESDIEALTLEIEDIHEIDLQQMLDSALAEQNYKLAIRAKFLMALKELSIGGLIDWSHEKTNRDYSRELRTQPCLSRFKHIANIYERAWYGDISPSKAVYENVGQSFDELNQFIMNQTIAS